MSPISVLHLMNGFGDSSICWIVHRLIRNSDRTVFQWYVSGLCGLGTMQDKFDQLGAETINFSRPVNTGRYTRQRIRKYLIDHDIHIVHTHTPRTIFQASFAIYRLPQIVHVGTKHLLNSPGDRKYGLAFSVLDRMSLYLPDSLVAVSNTMYGQIVGQPGIQQRRVRAIPNAIPVEKFYVPEQRDACRCELGLLPAECVIGFCGRLEKVKRLDLLLRAYQQVLSEYPYSRLVIVGDGSKQREWQLLADQLGIANAIIWTGFRTDIPRILAALDIYVVPSANEGLSLSILEAMAAGKPVIATNVGGAPEAIKDGVSGLLVSPGSSQQLATAIIDLLSQPEKRTQLALAGRSFVRKHFSIRRMLDAYYDLYAELALNLDPKLAKQIL